MPQTKEQKRECNRRWYLKNRERLIQKQKEYENKNKDKRKKYRESPNGKKSRRITKWKYQGVLCFDWDLLHDLYNKTTHCEYCNCELYGVGNNKKCLDHDHSINDKFNVRGVICQICNLKDVLQ